MTVIKFRVYPYLIVWLLCCLFFYWLVRHSRYYLPFAYPSLAGIGIFIGLLVWLISKDTITITDFGIVHKTVFRKREILWPEVMETGLSLTPTYSTLICAWYIKYYSGRAEKQVDIIIGNYSRKDLGIIARALVANCPMALFDKEIKNMAEAKFPWYIF